MSAASQIRIRRIPELGWAVFDNGLKVLPAQPNAWFGSRKAAQLALDAVPETPEKPRKEQP